MSPLGRGALRVLHVTDGSRWAGIESHLWNLQRAMAVSEAVEPSFAFSCEGEAARRFRDAGADVVVLGRLPAGLRVLRRWVATARPEIVHVHGYLGALAAGVAAAGLPARLVSTFHARMNLDASPGSKIWWYSRLALRSAQLRSAHFIAVTQEIADDYLLRGVSAARMHVVRNGVDPSALSSQRLRPAADGQEGLVHVGAVGGLLPVKDHMLLLQSAALLVREGRDLCVEIAGDGPLRSALELRTRELGLEGAVRWLGFMPDIRPLLTRLTILAFTSRSEGVPYALLEALAHGVPVVAPALGGFLEVLRNEETALLVKPRTPEAFAEAIGRLIRDRELAAHLASSGVEATRGPLSAQRMLSDTLQVYRSALEDSASIA